MGFRFKRRIRVASGVRLNLSKSGVGASVGRTGLRFGLSYHTFFGRPVAPLTLRKAGYILLGLALCVGVAVFFVIQKT
jgi:Protein of unknown function (DUF4236)